MTFNRLLLTAAAAGLLSQQALAGHPAPCTDCPTPPPCSAEGGCYPNYQTYGYYRTTWGRWPGDYDETTSAKDEKSALPGRLIPKPTEEDRAAPAPSEPKEGNVDPGLNEGSGARELDRPALPPIPGAPGAAPAAPQGQPQNPGAAPADNGPPGLPPLPGFGPPPGIGAPPSSGIRPKSHPVQPAAVADDVPPPLPAGFAALLGDRSGVVRAGHQLERSPSDAPPKQRATPAFYLPSGR